MDEFNFNPEIWGPHYWFFLYTLALTYPINPNNITKKKYYDFIQNLPLFIPSNKIGNDFSKFLDEYPVSPYLDSRESFTKWIHFIHNKINIYIGKKSITYEEALNNYYNNYKLKTVKQLEEKKNKHKYIYASVILILITLIIFIIFNR